MARDPITGPISREEFKALVQAPFGEAVKVIRKYDPQFGRAEGEKFRWKVRGRCNSTVEAYVMAANQEEADKLADELTDAAFDYCSDGEIEIDSVEPDNR